MRKFIEKKISVVIPTLNEENNIVTLINEIIAELHNKDYEIIEEWTFYYDYYENGQKRSEISLKDNRIDGLITTWYENGQKSTEGTYKDEKIISEKGWNEDGSKKK